MSTFFHSATIPQVAFLLVAWFVKESLTGANNLHMVDGTDVAEVIGHDWFFKILDPPELAYTYKIRPAMDFGGTFNTSFYGIPLVLANPPCGCSAPLNTEEVEGAVLLVERGDCSFLSKAFKAQSAGASAVIISDNNFDNDFYFIDMVDDSTNRENHIHIPTSFLMGKNGYLIRETLVSLGRTQAIINIPVNISHLQLHQLNQPPWLVW